MIDHDALQQDFFIYVPGSPASVHLADVSTEAASYADAPDNNDGWVKIPLTEKLVVYARMAGEM